MPARYVEAGKAVGLLGKSRYNYREMAEMLRRGYAAVCEDMTPQQAWYARRRLRELLGEDVLVLPYTVEGGGRGYIIMRRADLYDEAGEGEEGSRHDSREGG
ncbi:MAG: hypothetical protein DRJ67_03660 [Thermoprotei archaeon]|nr:MAG: hypothetical protein DRJ67_03660 [Thermoprotei archaeon]